MTRTAARLGTIMVVAAVALGLAVGPALAAPDPGDGTTPPSASPAPLPAGATAAAPAAPPVPGAFVPLQAARVYDSRDPARVVDQGFAPPAGPLGPGQSVGVPIAGRGGVPEAGAGTVVLNITGTALFGSSAITVWPQGTPRPSTSSLSFSPTEPVTTTVVTKLGEGGAVSLFNVSGLSDATVDIVGWFPTSSPLASVLPQRLLDTRADGTPLTGGGSLLVPVGGRSTPVPAGSSVIVSVVGTDASAPTQISAFASDAAPPESSLMTLAPGQTLPNTAVVPIGPDGAFRVASSTGTADVLVDLIAVVPTAVGRAVTPSRVFDTRVGSAGTAGGTAPAAAGPLTPGETRVVTLAGRGGVPTSGVSSVLLNVTGITPAAPGAIGVWGAGAPPTTSAVVVPGGGVRSGFAVVPLSPDGTIQVADAGAGMDVVLDVVGWLAGTPDTSAGTSPTPTPGSAATGSSPGAPAPDGGQVLWQADFARGLSQFQLFDGNFVGAPQPDVSTGARPAVTFTMPGGGQRAEILPNFRSLRSGDDLYFGFSVTLAPGFPADTADWQVITQWKNDGEGSPPVSVKVGRGQFLLDGGFARGAPYQVPMGAATVGVPHKVVVHIDFQDGGGSVDAWVDGQQTLTGFRPPAGTLYPGLTSYVKTGIYRNTAIGTPGTLSFDDWRIATTYAAAYPR